MGRPFHPLPGEEAMNFGYTYIERGLSGAIENPVLRPFASFDECCAAAEKATEGSSADMLRCIQVVHCQYSGDECLPQLRPILKIFEPKK